MCVEMKINIEDFSKWKSSFEGNVNLRKEYGSRGALAFTDPANPNEITVVIKAMNKASMARARESGEFQSAMKEGGITGEPDIRFMNYVTELDN